MLYLSGAAQSSREVLDRLDGLMAEAGIGKPNLLTAQVMLVDPSLRHEHDAAWDAWVDPHYPPLKVFGKRRPFHPDAAVEILVTAAKQGGRVTGQ